MPSDLIYTLLLVGVFLVGDAITGYAAYLALSVWRGLAVPIYRSRALWTAFLAIIFAVSTGLGGNIDAIFPPPFVYIASIVIYNGLYTLILLALFAWIDRTINTLIRLDYLRRDLIGWKKVRFAYWALVAVASGLAFFSPPVGPASLPLFLVGGISLLIPVGYGSLALIIGSRRTTDMTFRTHAKWGGYLMVGVLLASLTYFATPSNIALQTLPYLLIAYSFYKMAKFLVPVNVIASAEP
jgi:hypothetical protein